MTPTCVSSVRRAEAIGFEVLEATTGEEGLELLSEQLPDVILLDVMMPGISAMTSARTSALGPNSTTFRSS